MSFDTVLNDLPRELWEILRWKPSNEQFLQLISLQNLLQEWNKKVNLTRLIDGNDYWISQIFDSLWPITTELQNPSQRLNIIDVGTGCGFPGLAIAIALPNASVTLVDSIYKKTYAVKEITSTLGLINRVDIRTERIELTGQDLKFRNQFDLAIARAVAKGPTLAEYLIPLLKRTGKAILYKGKWSENDQKELINALYILQAKIANKQTIQLPEARGMRNSITLVTTGKCPIKYPRGVGVPIKSPLSI